GIGQRGPDYASVPERVRDYTLLTDEGTPNLTNSLRPLPVDPVAMTRACMLLYVGGSAAKIQFSENKHEYEMARLPARVVRRRAADRGARTCRTDPRRQRRR